MLFSKQYYVHQPLHFPSPQSVSQKYSKLTH
jgi:hypothetical protein